MAYEESILQATKELGIPLAAFLIIIIWTAFWKLFGLWKSARSGHVVWFIVIALVNTVGILPIIYIFGFSEPEKNRKKNSKKKSKPRKN